MPFSGRAEVVESRHYVHPVSGRTFSLFSAWREPGSELVSDGWTIRWDGDGAVGTCRPAWKRREMAQEWADAWNRGERGAGLPPMPGVTGYVEHQFIADRVELVQEGLLTAHCGADSFYLDVIDLEARRPWGSGQWLLHDRDDVVVGEEQPVWYRMSSELVEEARRLLGEE